MTEQKQEVKVKKKSGSNDSTSLGKVVAVLGMMILLIIICVYLGVNQQKYASKLAQSQNKMTELQEKVNQMSDSVSSLDSQFTESQKVIEHISEKTGAKDEDWVLAEVSYLVRLANFNLQFSHNLPEAKLLLKTADKRVATLKNPKLLPVRQSLADNMAKLAAVPKVDTEGTLLELNALSSQVNELPIIATPEDVQNANKKHHHHHHHHEPGWKRNLEQSWKEIRKLVVVQYHDQPVSKLMSPANRAYLDMHLQLLLSQADWALMHGKEKLYKQSLQQAQIWVKNYYVGNSAKTQAMIHSLGDLAAINITPTYPDITDTLEVIQQTKADNKQQTDTGMSE